MMLPVEGMPMPPGVTALDPEADASELVISLIDRSGASAKDVVLSLIERHIDSSDVLKSLLEKNIVRIVGRKDVPGRPIIYGTNRKFLEVFNLRDLSDLPTIKELEG